MLVRLMVAAISAGDLTQFRGGLAALGAAFLWAIASLIYRLLGRKIPPLLLNALKGIMALGFIGLTLIVGRFAIPTFSLWPVVLLLLSGVLGIGLGDTAYFAALNQLGARRTLLLETLSPPIGAILAGLFLAESLSLSAWFGICLTLFGVSWVISERTTDQVVQGPHPWQGVLWALGAAIAQAAGAVMSRAALVNSEITPLWSTLLRLSAGTAIALLLFLGQYSPGRYSLGQRWSAVNATAIFSAKIFGIIAITAFGSTYLAIWLQQTALKFAPTGIAQTLCATSPLFILPLVASGGEKISWRTLLGVFVAITGITQLF